MDIIWKIKEIGSWSEETGLGLSDMLQRVDEKEHLGGGLLPANDLIMIENIRHEFVV